MLETSYGYGQYYQSVPFMVGKSEKWLALGDLFSTIVAYQNS